MTDEINNYRGYTPDETNNYGGYTPLDIGQQPPINTSNISNIQSDGCEGSRVHYRTPLNTFHCTACPVGIFAVLLFGSVFTLVLIQNPDDKTFPIFGYIFITIWGIGFIGVSGCGILCISIDIDPYSREIIIKTRKMCFCFGKKKVFQFDNVQKVIIQKDTSMTYNINDVHYDSFKMQILLYSNEVIDVFSGVIDKDYESNRVYGIFRKSLPNNILVELDLN